MNNSVIYAQQKIVEVRPPTKGHLQVNIHHWWSVLYHNNSSSKAYKDPTHLLETTNCTKLLSSDIVYYYSTAGKKPPMDCIFGSLGAQRIGKLSKGLQAHQNVTNPKMAYLGILGLSSVHLHISTINSTILFTFTVTPPGSHKSQQQSTAADNSTAELQEPGTVLYSIH